MKKVFYFLNTVPEWVEVVKELEEKKNWKPMLWVTSEVLQPLISEKLKDTKILDLQSHRRGEFKNFSYSDTRVILDKIILNEYIQCEKIVIPMMNRMDPSRHNFAYHQRIQLYYKILIFWIDTFDKMKPDLIFFDETPHIPFEYIMHEVAYRKGVKIIRFNATHINHRLLFFGEINRTPTYLKKEYEVLKNNNIDKDYTLSNDIEEYYNKLQGTYKEAIPFYMKKNKIEIGIKIKKYTSIFKRALQNVTDSSYQRSVDGYLQDYKTIKFIKAYNRLMGYRYKNRLLKIYKSLTIDVDLSKNYVYVPLHFQPERTTSPEGDVYENQWLMIQLLAQTIPKGWKVYIKEHVSQFRKDFSGEMGRHIEFYQDVLSFDNVELVPLSINSFDLIDNSKAIATVTGTVGLESIVRNKRAMIFGYPWFEICEGISQIKNSKDSINFFSKIIKTPINQNNVRLFFTLIDKVSLRANHTNSIWMADLDRETNIQNLVKLVQQYESEIE